MSGSHSSPRLSRRTTLGAALAVPAVVSGCSLRGSSAASSRSAPSASAPVSPAAAAANPDQPLVDRVVAALGADAGAPADFRTLHAAQVKALGGPASGGSTAPRGDWKTRQKQLLATLTDAAVAAQDPHLVTLLASCAAAQRQLLHGRGLA